MDEILQQMRDALGIGGGAVTSGGGAPQASVDSTAVQDGLAPATEVMNWLTDSVTNAIPELTAFAVGVAGVVFVWHLVNMFIDSYTRVGPLFPYGPAARAAWTLAGSLIAIAAYSQFAIPFFNSMFPAGMALGGADAGILPAGELAKYADTVNNSIETSIRLIREQGIWDRIAAIPEVIMMKLIWIGIWAFFVLLALIHFWLSATYLFGVIMGLATVGLIAWSKTQPLGMKSFSFAIHSGLPLLALGFLTSILMEKIEAAIMPDGTPASMDMLWHILTVLFMSTIFTLAIPAVAKGFMFGMVGMGGAPDVNGVARPAGAMGAAISNVMNSIKSIGSNGGGGGKSLPSPGGAGAGFSPKSSGGAPSMSPTTRH